MFDNIKLMRENHELKAKVKHEIEMTRKNKKKPKNIEKNVEGKFVEDKDRLSAARKFLSEKYDD